MDELEKIVKKLNNKSLTEEQAISELEKMAYWEDKAQSQKQKRVVNKIKLDETITYNTFDSNPNAYPLTVKLSKEESKKRILRSILKEANLINRRRFLDVVGLIYDYGVNEIPIVDLAKKYEVSRQTVHNVINKVKLIGDQKLNTKKRLEYSVPNLYK